MLYHSKVIIAAFINGSETIALMIKRKVSMKLPMTVMRNLSQILDVVVSILLSPE